MFHIFHASQIATQKWSLLMARRRFSFMQRGAYMPVRKLHIITSFHWRKKRYLAIVVLGGKSANHYTGRLKAFFFVNWDLFHEDNVFLMVLRVLSLAALVVLLMLLVLLACIHNIKIWSQIKWFPYQTVDDARLEYFYWCQFLFTTALWKACRYSIAFIYAYPILHSSMQTHKVIIFMPWSN